MEENLNFMDGDQIKEYSIYGAAIHMIDLVMWILELNQPKFQLCQ